MSSLVIPAAASVFDMLYGNAGKNPTTGTAVGVGNKRQCQLPSHNESQSLRRMLSSQAIWMRLAVDNLHFFRFYTF